MKNTIFILFLSLFFFQASAQKKYTISGYVKDKTDGGNSVGASVYIKEILKGATTNAYGLTSMLMNGNRC